MQGPCEVFGAEASREVETTNGGDAPAEASNGSGGAVVKMSIIEVGEEGVCRNGAVGRRIAQKIVVCARIYCVRTIQWRFDMRPASAS